MTSLVTHSRSLDALLAARTSLAVATRISGGPLQTGHTDVALVALGAGRTVVTLSSLVSNRTLAKQEQTQMAKHRGQPHSLASL